MIASVWSARMIWINVVAGGGERPRSRHRWAQSHCCFMLIHNDEIEAHGYRW